MTREDACDLIANHEKQMFNITYPTCAGTEVIDKIYDDFENQKCTNCKYYTKCEDNFNYCDKNSLLNGFIHDEFGCINWSER